MSADPKGLPMQLVEPMVEESIRTFRVTREERIEASIEIVFESILEQLSDPRPNNEPMPMKLEPWPGGRWYRTLGGENGHMWCHVQAIRRPDLLELYGPMFMSFPVTSNIQFRLKAEGNATVMSFCHAAMGVIPDEVAASVHTGWDNVLRGIRERAAQR